MIFNIFRDETELIGIASVRETEEGISEAEIHKDPKTRGIEVGYKVRTR